MAKLCQFLTEVGFLKSSHARIHPDIMLHAECSHNTGLTTIIFDNSSGSLWLTLHAEYKDVWLLSLSKYNLATYHGN